MADHYQIKEQDNHKQRGRKEEEEKRKRLN
jgi:ribosomal protein S15P/S13E